MRNTSIRFLALALLLSVPFLTLGIHWGLPTRSTDRFLFGDRTPWTGAEIQQLAGAWNPSQSGGEGGAKGADVQRDAPIDRSRPVLLNETDAQRADLVRRYRLYTFQPDEMINLRAFSGMNPSRGQFDPRLYQYGGLWIYPGAAVLKVASAAGWVTLTPDVAYYIDRPDEIGRMYVWLRAMSAVWGLAGVAAVWVLARQMGAHPLVASVVALGLATSPGLVVFAHEAKPHVPGMALVLWSVVAAVAFVRRGGAVRLALSAGLAGAAMAMVVSMLPAGLIPVSALFLRRSRPDGREVSWLRGAAVSLAAAAGVYAVTNPYVVLHLFNDPSRLTAQLGNSTAMYRVTSPLGTLGTVFYLLVSLTPAVLLVFPAMYFVLGDMQRLKRGEKGVFLPVGLLVMAPSAVAVLLIFAALAAGKPGEFARFGLVVAAFGVLCGGYLATRFRMPLGVPLVVVLLNLVLSVPELARFIADSQPQTTRWESANRLAAMNLPELTLSAEPAPYNTPPVDLWKTRLVLLPAGTSESPTLAQPPEADGYWRMSWAGRENGLRAGKGEPRSE